MKVTRRTGSLVIVLVIFAAIVLGTALAAIAIDKSEIPMLQQHAAEAAVTADGYTHGSNIGRQTSGNAVSNESQLVSALNSNGTYYLTRNITLTAGSGGAFSNTRSFSGTLYGNGHTVTIEYSNGSAVKNANQNEGGLVSTLTGRIYDLNVVLSSGTTIKRGRETDSWLGGHNPSTYNLGIIAGYINGGTVENCTVTINSDVTIWAFSWRSNDWASFGTIAGRAYNANIINCTTVNNGEIKAGAASNTSVSDVSIASENSGSASNLVGYYEAGNYTIDNIVVSGNGYLRAFVSSPLGILSTAGISIHMTNFYDKTTNSKIINGNNYWSYTFLKWTGSPDVKISNLYRYGDTQHDMNAGITPGAEVKINRSSTYSIYFDPKATDTSKSLVVVAPVDNGGANYTATITGVNNNSYSDGYYAFNSAGDTVVFRNLPTAASNWSSGGNFTCTITTTRTEIQVPTYDDLTKWEHGYVADDTTTSGTEAISTGTQFENIFRPNGSLNQSGTYYLTDDIAITGFTGKEFSGTLDGNGHTIFIVASNTGMTGQYIGGLVGTLSGTIKNVRVVITTSLTVSTSYDGGRAFGLVAGNIKGSGKIENVNVVLQNGVTVTTGGGNTSALGGVSGYMESGTITKTTVQMDGILNVQGTWSFVAGIVGRLKGSNTANTFNFSDVILKGSGKFAGSASGDTNEPKYVAAIAVTSGSFSNKPINLNGFIYALTSKMTDNNPLEGNYSSYGFITRNEYKANSGGDAINKGGYINDSTNIYKAENAAYEAINKLTHGNNYVDIPATATISTYVADSTIPVTPYFPASSNGNLVLVAGDGTVTVPDLQYTNSTGNVCDSTADGNYKVVTVAKAKVDTATVTLEEPVIPAEPIDDLNQWENGYVASPRTGNVSTAADLTTAIEENRDIILSKDIRDFTGFAHTGTYTGTLDGNGHTIYIVRDGGASGTNIGGLFSTLTGTVKNLRLVITTGADRSNTKYLGGIAGALDGRAIVENVFVAIPAGVNLVTTRSGRDVGGVGGIAGGLINGSGETVSISNTTVELQGTLKATANWTFVGGFVGHLNGVSGTDKGAINYTNTTFKGSGLLDGVANGGEGVHTAALGIVGGNVSAVNVDGVINSFNGTLSSGRSAYAIIVRNSQDTNITVSISNVYTFGPVTTYDGSMNYGKPVDSSSVTKVISTEVLGTTTPVTPYFPASASGNLVLVAGNGSESVTTPLAYNNGTNSFVSEAVTVDSAEYQVVTVAKENVKTDPDSVSLEIAAVNDPELTDTDFTYSGQNGIDVTIGTLKYGSDVLELGKDYTITIAAVAGGSVVENKPVNVGEYTLTVTLKNHNFADDSNEKVLNFTVSPKAVTVTVTADERAYDGTTNVTLSGGELSGVVSGDSVTANLGTGTAAQAGVGTGISVTVNVTLTGDHAANYVLQSQPTVTVNITPKVLSFTAGTTSFPFANTTGTAITDQNLKKGATYSVNVTGFVETDPDEDKAYTLTVADPSYITERTADGDGSKFLTVGKYTVTLSPASGNYTFGSNNTFTFDVTKNESANTWIKEYAREGWTYYSNPTAETAPVARFGTANVSYVGVTEFSKTTAKGDYTVNVSVAETDNYGALTKEYSFTVSALDVTVALSAAGTVYDGQAYEASNISITLTATVNGTETTYTSADNSSDVSTLLRNYGWQYSAEGVTETTDGLPTNAGIYTLYIYNYSNSNVNVTGTLNCTATIAKAEVTFSAAIAGGAELVYGTVPEDFNSLVNVTASGGINLSAEDWSFAVTPSVASGEYTAKTPAGTTVTLTVQVSVTDPNHTAVQPAETLTLVIQKADIGEISVTNFGEVTIGFTSYKGFVYGQAEPLEFSGIPADLTATPVYTYAVQGGAQINNFDISKANCGIYTVTVSISGDTNYNDKTSEAIEFAIAKANQSVTVKIDGWTYKETENAPVIEGIKESATTTVSYSGTTNADTNNLYGPTDVVPTEAGTYTVTVSWVETTNYTAGSVESVAFTIKRATGFANISVNGTPYTKTVTAYYMGSKQTFIVTVEGHGGAIDINGTPSSTLNYNLTNVGPTTVEVTVAQTPNYTEATATAEIEILPAVIESVTLKSTDFTFGTLNTENANAADTYGDLTIGFAEGKGGGTPAFTYSLSYNNTESGSDKKAYIVVGEEYILTLALTGETAANFVFDGNTSTTAVTVQVTKGVNTWISEDKIDDYVFGFAGKAVTGTAKFGTAAVTYYRGDVRGQADKGEAIEFSFAQRAQDAGTYTAVVSVPANDNYDGISYEYAFVVEKHGLNITNLTISGTGVSGSAADGFTVTYAADMGLSATVSVGSAEGYTGLLSVLLGSSTTRTYLFEYSAADPDVWTDGLPKDAGTYTVRFKGMELAEGYNIDNFEFEFVSVPSVPVPSVKLTIDRAEITVTAKIPENSVVYGMTADDIRNLIILTPEEGVTLGEVTVTYNNGTAYDETVVAGTELTISVSVNAENENYIAKFEGGASTTELTATVQKATLNVSAKDSSELSADFYPDKFNKYAAITATWDETPVTAIDYYFNVELTGYEGDVAGMTAEENFANGEIGTYTFTVRLKKEVQGNFVADPETIVYELTLAKNTVKLTVAIDSWTYGDSPATPKFTAIVTDEEGNETDILQIVGQYITVNYSNGSGYNSPVQPTDAGTYTLTANIVGHHDYVTTDSATADFTISPAEVTFSAAIAKGAKLVYGTVPTDFNSLVTVIASGGINLSAEDWSFDVTPSGEYGATTAAGTTVTLTVEVSVTDPNYTAVQPSETLTLEIQKAEQSVDVSIDGGGWTYGETAKGPDIDGIKENAVTTVTYSGTTNAGEKYDSATAPKEAGTYTVTVSWKETTNYKAGEAAPVEFTVEKAKLTKPTANVDPFVYTGAEQTYTPDGFDPDTMTIAGNVQTNAGKYTVTVSVTDKYNYVWADGSDTGIEFSFVIGKAEQSVNVSIDGWTYGDTAKDYEIVGIMESADTTAFYSGTTNAGVKYDSATAPTAAGSYTVTVSWVKTDNYTAGKAEPVAFVIAKAEIAKPSAHDGTFVYTGAAQTYTPDGFDAATMTIAGNVQTNAGNYTVTVSVTDKDNYVWADDTDTDITFTFVIAKAAQSVNVSIDGWTYGDTAKEYSVEGIMENADYTVSYSGDGYSADTAPVNAGSYTLTITVDATANYNDAVVSAEFTIDPKKLHVSDSVMIIEAEYGELTLDDISSDEAILTVIGDYTAIFDGLVYDDVLTPDDFTLTAAEDYSDLVADGFMAVADYSIKVALNDSLTNYVVPESGLENITFRVVKAANSIGRYYVSGWTYLEVRSEYIPAFSAAVFGTVVGSFFDENGTEIAVDDFGATTPAGTYTFRLSVADSDNYSGATGSGSFVVDKRIVVAELTATDVTYDGAVYDGISYTLSPDVSDYIGTVGFEYSENGSAFRKGLPTDAGNYSVRIGEYSDSENIELRAETVDFQINPAPMHFTVTGVDGASIEYGTAIDDIDMNALIASVIPDSYVGGFEFTVSLITANGTAYRPGLYAGTVLYATVNITLNSNNYYPVVDTAIEMLPKVNITKVYHDMVFEVNDEIITDGSSAAVIEGSANTVIDAISYYMSVNGVQYYEYHITVDGEEYSRDFVWAPGTHTVEVRLSGNHEGSTQFTVVIEEDPDAVDRAPFTPKTVVGEVLESINFTWASAVSIAFGVAVAVLIILFFGLRRAKKK